MKTAGNKTTERITLSHLCSLLPSTTCLTWSHWAITTEAFERRCTISSWWDQQLTETKCQGLVGEMLPAAPSSHRSSLACWDKVQHRHADDVRCSLPRIYRHIYSIKRLSQRVVGPMVDTSTGLSPFETNLHSIENLRSNPSKHHDWKRFPTWNALPHISTIAWVFVEYSCYYFPFEQLSTSPWHRCMRQLVKS